MIRIFSKLRLIITITIVSITLLFALLVYNQYNAHQKDVFNINQQLHQDLSQDIKTIEILYKNLSTVYEEELIKNNNGFTSFLKSYINDDNLKDLYVNKLNDLLTSAINSANENMFSSISLYDYNDTLITEASITDPTEVSKSFTYPIYSDTDLLGYLEYQVPYSAICKTLDSATEQQVYTIFSKNLMSDEALENKIYIDSPYGNTYLMDSQLMARINQYASLDDYKVLENFQNQVISTIYEPLMANENFTRSKEINGFYYSLVFIRISDFDGDSLNPGYYVYFKSNPTLTSLENSLVMNVSLFIILYIILLIVIGFIYYILHYLYNFSYTDNLTKVYNRHKFFEVIKHNIYEYHRYNYMFSVILIDIDNFKSINDALGHNTGDRALVDFASILNDSLRTTDYLFRWGGEEFLVLLSHCEGKTAYQVAEKLRKSIEHHNFQLKSGYQVTASFGVASYKDSTNVEIMISHADKALYESKSSGKNCTTLYSSQPKSV